MTWPSTRMRHRRCAPGDRRWSPGPASPARRSRPALVGRWRSGPLPVGRTAGRRCPADAQVQHGLGFFDRACALLTGFQSLKATLACRRLRSHDGIPETSDEGYIDAVSDEETSVIENLLGAAFVVCQTYLTGVVSQVTKLNKWCERQFGESLPSASGRRIDILGRGVSTSAVTTGGTRYTVSQVTDAFANYFKHRDEWKTVDWTKLDGQAQGTASDQRQLLLPVGDNYYCRLEPGCS